MATGGDELQIGENGSSLPAVCVIVPHYSDLANLSRCLDALERQAYPRDRFDVIVVDNGSPEGERAALDAIRGRARLLIALESGAASARNAGVAASSAAILAFTDSDCTPEPGWLEAGVRALSQFSLVGGCVSVLVRDPERMTGVEAFERVFAFDNRSYVTTKGFSVTANLFCDRRLFEIVGGFRPGVPEDLDWCRRVRAAGYRLGYEPKAIVGHPARQTWRELIAKWRRLNAEAFGLSVTKPGGRLIWLARSLALPVSALIHTPRALVSRDLTTRSQRLSALGILYRLRLWRFRDGLSRLMGAGAQAR